MSWKRTMVWSGLALGVLSTSACGASAGTASKGGSADGGAQSTLVVMSEFKFDPVNVVIKAGQPTKVTARNSGAVVHDWLVNLDGQQYQAKANPGQTAAVEFIAPKAGTYRVVCTEPGHEQAGMVGQLVVQ